MSYFDDASLVFIPSGTKVSKAYSVKPIDGTGDLTFSRSNDTATRVASNGLIERVRTNLALQSQTFDNASWVKAFATITANATTAPDGTLTADKLIANIGYDPVSATGNLRQTNIVATNTHTISLYAKAAEFTSIRFRENFIVGAFLTIDLTNGSITGAGSQYINPTATAVGDGWYRISFVTPATADLDKYSIRVANTGDGTSGVFIWGFQYEVSDFGATPYIATTSAAVSVGPVANVPRLDYLGSSCPRLLLEPQRTNILPQSQYFGGSEWTKSNASVTGNNATSPEGIQNASLLTISAAVGNIYENVGGSGNFTFSVFAKYVDMQYMRLRSTASYVYFDIQNGSVETEISGTGSIEDYGNGWYRCSVIGNNTNSLAQIFLSDTEGGTPTGTGSALIYGAQFEAGNYVTSLIPTYGASVTRGADAASKTGISSLIGQTEGTLYWEGEKISDVNYASHLVIENGTTNRIYLLSGIAGFRVDVTSGGTSTAFYSGAQGFGTYKIAIAYSSAGVEVYINGASVFTDSSVTIPACQNLYLSGWASYNQAAETSQVLLFKTRLTNAQLAELTTL
jgi:hypothetical protein